MPSLLSVIACPIPAHTPPPVMFIFAVAPVISTVPTLSVYVQLIVSWSPTFIGSVISVHNNVVVLGFAMTVQELFWYLSIVDPSLVVVPDMFR